MSDNSDSIDQAMRAGFRNDEEYIKWIQASNRALNRQISRLELQLQQERQENDK
jgi:hypothetical protein